MSRRGTLILISVLTVLAATALYLHFSDRSTTTGEDASRHFAYRDTASVTRIFIADKEGNRSEVVRTRDGWWVNNKYRCRSEAILNLLEVIRNVDVKMPVPRQAKENVVRIMAAAALKVEIYAGDDLVKQYYVGHEAPDGEGSYMLLTDLGTGKNFSEPYVCFIPGFMGYLLPRFIAKEHEWRDRQVIDFIPPEMAKIEVIHRGQPDSSFTIELLSTTEFRLTDGKNRQLAFDEGSMKQYLSYFQNLHYEALITGRDQKLQDSLATAGPFCQITVTARPFRQDVFGFYRKSFAGQFEPELGVTYDYDPDRMYMRFGSEWAIGQYFVFGKLFVNANYFAGNSVKK